MQVSVKAVNWEQLVAFGSAGNYLDSELEAESELIDCVSCYDYTDWGDSAVCYFRVASALDHLIDVADQNTAVHLKHGLGKVIAENGHPDDFQMYEISEGHCMLSMSPSTVKEVQAHIGTIDLRHCISMFKEYPVPGEEEGFGEIFLWVTKQYIEMVNLAAEKNYGLLAHCG